MSVNDTFFAPAPRDDYNQVCLQHSKIKGFYKIENFLNAVPDIFLILNDKRQIVYANKAITDFLQKSFDLLLGLRPGEALGCIHADECDNGCGTSRSCKMCGAVNAIISGLSGMPDVQECRITLAPTGDALELKVWTNPFYFEKEKYVLFAVQDISHEKRRRGLERVFFHDIMNNLAVLKGITDILLKNPKEIDDFKYNLSDVVNTLVEEVNVQKELASAEANELKVLIETFLSTMILDDLIDKYNKRFCGFGVNLKIDEDTQDIIIKTDVSIFRRIMANLITNALEASGKGETVTLSCKKQDNHAVFSIHNEQFIPLDVQLQIFKRTYSTKESRNGIGTYYSRMLAQKYLNGNVHFISTMEAGTTFFVYLPLSQNAN